MFLTYSSGDEDDEVEPPTAPMKRRAPEPNKAPAAEVIQTIQSKRRKLLERRAGGEEGGEGTKGQRTFFAVARQEAREATEKVRQARGNPAAAPQPVLPSLRGRLLDSSPAKPKRATITFFSCNQEAYRASNSLRPNNSQRVYVSNYKPRRTTRRAW
ncbi:hypothetical protein TWF718_006749 [Orbilia javanica]|uniref:Uncharacterized protein n=1 Tax=Orbilia javanica TaxID=47235 RepID=A0AAN8MYX5_9PEZI